MDRDQSGLIELHEFRVFLTRKYDNTFRKVSDLK